jgi:hypothetical protein
VVVLYLQYVNDIIVIYYLYNLRVSMLVSGLENRDYGRGDPLR